MTTVDSEMRVTTVLFDLDGTLLPMDQEVFARIYFAELGKKGATRGYDARELAAAVWQGMGVMAQNDGSKSNEEAFWSFFASKYGAESVKDRAFFEDFYRNEFARSKDGCGFNREAAETVALLREKGYRVALATNPVFPAVATERRIGWAGLSLSDFELVTVYENSRYCKPNPLYYREVCEKLGCRPQECLMVGNDVGDDMPAADCGMKVFLLTDCLINGKNADISAYPQGGFGALKAYIGRIGAKGTI